MTAGSIRVGTKTFAPGTTIRVGRETDCDVVVDDPTVSRHHLTIAVEGDAWIIRDLGSSNGTFVAGNRVSSLSLGAEPVTLRLGSRESSLVVVALAGTATVVGTPQPAPAAADPAPPTAQMPVVTPAEAPVVATPQPAPVAAAATPVTMDERIGIVAALLVLIGSLLPWFSGGGASISSWNISVLTLAKGRPSGGPSAGIVLLIASLLIAAHALAPRLTGRTIRPLIAMFGASLAIDVGVIAIAAALKTSSGLGIGMIVAIAGGLVIVGNKLYGRARARRVAA